MVSSTIAFHLAYNAWGQCNYASPTSEEGPPYLTHAYNARWGYLADETGLYYCQNRYYDPVTGRFLTRDPIGYDGGANLYGYCGGNPVLNADPWGLWKWPSLEDLGNFFAGWGDNLTFGGTKWVRRAIGEWSGIGDANEAVDYDSGWYAGGEAIGTVHSFALGGAGGWKLGAKAVGREFSHFIPKRMLKELAADGNTLAKNALGKVWWNGNYVSPRLHSLTDPFRFLKRATYGEKALLPPLLRYPLRVPFPISGSLLEGGAASVYDMI